MTRLDPTSSTPAPPRRPADSGTVLLRTRKRDGTWVGSARRVRRVDGEEERRARALLSAGFPVLHRYLVPWLHRLRGNTTVHYELVTLDQPEPRPTDASTGES